MFVKSLVPAALALGLLAGCNTTSSTGGTTAASGNVIGAKFGSGGKFADNGVDSLVGAFIGPDIRSSLSQADQEYAEKAARTAYAGPIGDWVPWQNPQTGNSGTIVALREGYNSAGTYCRVYRMTVSAGGKSDLAFGTACKQADGAWKIVRNS